MKNKSIHGDRAKVLLYNAILSLEELETPHETLLKELKMSEREYKEIMKE